MLFQPSLRRVARWRVRFFEHDQVIAVVARKVFCRENFKVDALQSAVMFDQHAILSDGPVSFDVRESQTQLDLESRLDHLQQIQAGLARTGIEKTSRLSVELNDIELLVYHYAGRRIAVQENLIGDFLQIHAGRRSFRARLRLLLRILISGEIQMNWSQWRFFPVDLVLLVHRSKQIGRTANRLGGSEE